MDSFYITLPSTASMDIYPNNAVSHYTTRLQKPLELDGKWGVGLCEVSLPMKLMNVETNSQIRLVIDETDDQHRKHYFRSNLRPGFYESARQLIKEMNLAWKRLKKKLPDHLKNTNYSSDIFVYDDVDNEVRLKENAPEKVDVSESLALMLGIGEGKKSWERITFDRSVNSRPVNMNAKVPHIYLYTDIVQYVPVGHTLAPLLRIIPVDSYIGNNRQEYFTKIYQKPHYIPVARQYIEKIDIDLRNELGEYVPFVGGKSIVKLHFQRMK